MVSAVGLSDSTPVAALERAGSAPQSRLDAARHALESRGLMVTPGALAAAAGVSTALAREYLRAKGAAIGSIPKTPIMQDFVTARAARATIAQAVSAMQTALPAAYAPPPRPPTDLLDQTAPRLRRRYPDVVAWDRGLIKALPVGLAAAIVPYVYLTTHDHATSVAVGASALVAGVVTALPSLWNAAANFFERRSVAKANAQIERDEAKQVEAFHASREANAVRIKQQQDDLDAWVAANSSAADVRAGSITSAHLEPIRKALEGVKDTQLKKQLAAVARPALEQLLAARRAELSIGAAADAESWIALAQNAGSPSTGTLLGCAIDHFDTSDPKQRYWLDTNLATIKDASAAAIADAYRARHFESDAARSPGLPSEQVRTLVMLKKYGSAV